MKNETLRVGLFEVEEAMKVKEIGTGLTEKQALVNDCIALLCTIEAPDGLIDVYMGDNAICNNCDINRVFFTNEYMHGYPYVSLGTCFAIGYEPETGESISLTDKQIEFLEKLYNKPCRLISLNGHLVILSPDGRFMVPPEEF